MIKPKLTIKEKQTKTEKKDPKKKKQQRSFIMSIIIGIINWFLDAFRNLGLFHKSTIKEVKMKPMKRTKIITQQNRMEMKKSKRIFMRPNRTSRIRAKR